MSHTVIHRRVYVLALLAILVPTIAVLGLTVDAARARADVGVGSWSGTGAMSEGWEGGSAVALADGRVLAVRRGEHGAGEHGVAELYDPGSGAWTRGLELPASGLGQWTVVALAESGALLLGETSCGEEGRECLPTTSAYRLSSNGSELLPAAPMRQARVNPVAVRLTDGDVLVAGGFGDECPEINPHGYYSCQPLASAEVYDPTSNEWTPTAPMPQSRGGASAALLSDGTVLVVGGHEAREVERICPDEEVEGESCRDDEPRDAVRYDPDSGTWTAAGQTVSPRTGSLLLALPGDRALALGSQQEMGFFGSLDGTGERAAAKCIPIASEIFTAASGVWTISPIEPAGSENCVNPLGALLAGGQILLGGSYSYPQGILEGPYVLDSEQRCWSATAPPVEQRSEGGVVALSDGRALVFGGRAAGGYALSSAEIYTPGPLVCATSTSSEPNPSEPASAGTSKGTPSGTTSGSPRFTGVMIMRRGYLTVTAGGLVRVLLRCPARAVGRCVGQVRLGLSVATSSRTGSGRQARHLYLGDSSFSIPAGNTRPVTVRLIEDKRMLDSIIHRWGRATIVLTTIANDDTGQVVTATMSGMLRKFDKTRLEPSSR